MRKWPLKSAGSRSFVYLFICLHTHKSMIMHASGLKVTLLANERVNERHFERAPSELKRNEWLHRLGTHKLNLFPFASSKRWKREVLLSGWPISSEEALPLVSASEYSRRPRP